MAVEAATITRRRRWWSATMESIDCCEINNFMIKKIRKIDRIGEENLRREEKGEVVTASNFLVVVKMEWRKMVEAKGE